MSGDLDMFNMASAPAAAPAAATAAAPRRAPAAAPRRAPTPRAAMRSRRSPPPPCGPRLWRPEIIPPGSRSRLATRQAEGDLGGGEGGALKDQFIYTCYIK